MNKDELKGKMKVAAGRAEREVGKATGDKKTVRVRANPSTQSAVSVLKLRDE